MARSGGLLTALSVLLWLAPLGAHAVTSPDGLWRILDTSEARAHVHKHQQVTRWIEPEVFRLAILDQDRFKELAERVPREVLGGTHGKSAFATIDLPMPDGEFLSLRIVEAPVVAERLQEKYPAIRTFAGTAVHDRRISVRLDWTPQGFHAQVLSPDGAIYIDPYVPHESYVVYRKDALPRGERTFSCGQTQGSKSPGDNTDDTASKSGNNDAKGAKDTKSTSAEGASATGMGTKLRTYRLALACTGEYAQFHSQNLAEGVTATEAVYGAFVTLLNRVNGIYETEFAIRMELVGNNDSLIYLDPDSDPYTNDNADSLLGENQSNLANIIGNDNFDIGHVVSTGGGGVAALGSVCRNNKARGVTGRGEPVGDPFWVDYVAHEIGHQFDLPHSFAGDQGSCDDNYSSANATEPGSGVTIMGYAGICGADNLASNSIPYFHGVSFDRLRAFVTTGEGANCGTVTDTGLVLPTVEAGGIRQVPVLTPFRMTGSAPEGITGATYSWEPVDLAAQVAASACDNGSNPLFQSRAPSASTEMIFPADGRSQSDCQGGSYSGTLGEQLPSVGRLMRFRITARANSGSGIGTVDYDQTTVRVRDDVGPLIVATPTGVSACTNDATWSDGTHSCDDYAANPNWCSENADSGALESCPVACGSCDQPATSIRVAWRVNGTDSLPNASLVDLHLSTDDGQSWPHVLAEDTPNDGETTVALPAGVTASECRVRVQAASEHFFAVSGSSFSLDNGAIATPQCAGWPCHDANDPCAASSCADGQCVASVKPQGAFCDDGDPNTKNDVCMVESTALVCPPLTYAGCCDSDNRVYYCGEESTPASSNCDYCGWKGSQGFYDCIPEEGAVAEDPSGNNPRSCDAFREFTATCQGTAFACEVGVCQLSSEPSGNGCNLTFAPAGTPCDDGVPWSQGDSCDGQGRCAGLTCLNDEGSTFSETGLQQCQLTGAGDLNEDGSIGVSDVLSVVYSIIGVQVLEPQGNANCDACLAAAYRHAYELGYTQVTGTASPGDIAVPDSSVLSDSCVTNGTPASGDVNGDDVVGLTDVLNMVAFILGDGTWLNAIGPLNAQSVCHACHQSAALAGFNAGIGAGCTVDGGSSLCTSSLSGQDCGCAVGEVFDCNNNCAPEWWRGDGYCDDGAYAHNDNFIFFNCDYYSNDGGDCDSQ